MMMCRTMVLLLCLAPSALWSQEFTAQDLEKVIKQDLGKDFEKKAQGKSFDYDVKDTPFFILYNTDAKFINVYTVFPAKEAPLEKLNAWNQKAVHSRVFHDAALKAVVFEVPMSIAAGATRAQIKNLYQNAEAEIEDFKKHVRGNP